MDWTFWYFVGLGWLSLAILWMPALVALVATLWRGRGDQIGAFLERHGSLIGSLISTGVTAIGVVAAWIAVQSQIGASNDATRKQIEASNDSTRQQIAAANEATNRQITATIETTKLQVEAALATANQQIEEGRKQHRLEYLRQYLGQLEAAVTWLHKADRQQWSRSRYAADEEPYKTQLQRDLDDEIAFMASMPHMPFYDDKGTRPADRRDDVVEAIKRYKIAFAEPKKPEAYGEDERVKKAADAVREADRWSDDYWAVWTLERDAREELKRLESEIEYNPKR